MEITLTSIFDSHKEEFGDKLKAFSLPRDSKMVYETVSVFLNNMFENDGAYRQSLTQSEDYILQAAIELMLAQQNIAKEITSMASSFNVEPQKVTEPTVNPYIHVVGTGVGAAAGSLLGTWGIICGAIAGTAISLYMSTRSNKRQKETATENVVNTINVNAFTNIMKKICESIDNLMATYRVQVKRIENAFNSKEDVTLQNSFSILLDKIANILNTVERGGDTVPSKIKDASSMLAESLENYGMIYKDGKIINDTK